MIGQAEKTEPRQALGINLEEQTMKKSKSRPPTWGSSSTKHQVNKRKYS